MSNQSNQSNQSIDTKPTYNIISIEGNIGSGKSTLLESLKKEYNGVHTGVVFLDEPVESWNTIRDKEGNTMLEKFYRDQEKYSFPFQMMAFISRLAVMKDAVKHNPGCIFITERCLYTDKYVFAKMLHDAGKIEDVNYQIYNQWFDTFVDEFMVSHIVYVTTSPDVCHERVKTRARDGEDVIPIEYLTDCHTYHKDMMKVITTENTELPITIIDGNVNIYNDPFHLRNWMSRINDIVRKML